MNLLQMGFAYCLAYPMMKLNGHPILMVLTNWGLGLASGSMAVLLGICLCIHLNHYTFICISWSIYNVGCAISDIKTVTGIIPTFLFYIHEYIHTLATMLINIYSWLFIELSPLLFVPQLLFAGFFIKTDQIPVFLRWAQYLCSLKYAINLILCIEFDVGNDSCDGAAR